MVKRYAIILILFIMALGGCSTSESISPGPNLGDSLSSLPSSETIRLPAPSLKGNVSLEEGLSARRSIRDYSLTPLTLDEVSQLLWAAQGITDDSGGRTAPSAGGLYPLEVYLVTDRVVNLKPGIYRYIPVEHSLLPVKAVNIREDLAGASLGQTAVKKAAVNIIISAVYERTTTKYGDRGIRYTHIEAGHVAQNICLQATALKLGVVTIGAFQDERVKIILGMPDNENPLYIIPVGHR